MKKQVRNHSASILVTGASGFIGGKLCSYLVQRGHRVLGVVRRDIALPNGVIPLHADVSQADQVREIIDRQKPDVIFHLASHVTGERSIDFVLPTFVANLASTVYLMDAAVRNGCRRFVVAGSLEEPESVDEPPCSPYAAAKMAAAAYARMFHVLYQLPVVVARIFMVYGPDQKDEKKLIPYVINSLLDGKTPKVSSGTRLVDWVYVDDVLKCLVRLAEDDRLIGHTVDIGTGHLVSVRTVVERIAHLIASNVPLHFDPGTDRPLEQIRVANVARTASLLGWYPQTSLDAGLQATINWHKGVRRSL